MKTLWKPSAASFAAILFLAPAWMTAASPRKRISFDENWCFIKGDPAGISNDLSYTHLKPWLLASGTTFTPSPPVAKPPGNPRADVAYAQPGFDDRGWQKLNLPNDWAIKGPFKQKYPGETAKLKYWSPVWYRKHFEIPAVNAGKEIHLDIDGAMSYSEVWLNGKFVGGWPYGYASFELNLTPFIRFGGTNVLAVRLDTPPNASRWHPGGGIYWNVWLVITGPIHAAHWGTFIRTN